MMKGKKILVLGVDGMDPSLTKKYLGAGLLPHIREYISKGSCREDLHMLGAMPTVTPPMWTTLATGAYPATHGITDFWNQDLEHLDTLVYAFDSRKCKAEQLWNVTAEDEQKTLVWHWPGSSWPPSSDSEYLHVVDGTSPPIIQYGNAIVDWEKNIIADESFEELNYQPKAKTESNGAGCILTDLDVEEVEEQDLDIADASVGNQPVTNIMLSHEEGELALEAMVPDLIQTPIREAEEWSFPTENAKEFAILTSNGFVKRYCLLQPNEEGKYTTVAIYKKKSDLEPLTIIQKNNVSFNVVDEIKLDDGETIKANRHYCMLDIASDGSHVHLWTGVAMNIEDNQVWHPTSLYHEVVDHVGYIPPVAAGGGMNPEIVEKFMLPCWEKYTQWQSKALHHLMDQQDYQIIFSHIHNVDACGHFFWHLGKHRDNRGNNEEQYQGFMQEVYRQTDNYLGSFLEYLDKGWSIFIVSDHGLLTTIPDEPPLIGDAYGVNVRVMQELGFTVLEKDKNGKELRKIDWSKTKAVATRAGHIWINLKGRNATGIVEPEDKYKLESEIIDALYNYRDPKTNQRVIAFALRNRDAAIIGMDGEECGDIVYMLAEGFNRVHGDSMPTARGYRDTSVSPIFIAAGLGIKENYRTERVIREVDITPTIATLAAVRMPAQCEGAPVYQILEDN